jgi:hypothetical protein
MTSADLDLLELIMLRCRDRYKGEGYASQRKIFTTLADEFAIVRREREAHEKKVGKS